MKSISETKLLKEIESRRLIIRASLLRWGRKNRRNFPWRINRSPYLVLVSEILLKRTTATAVVSIFEKFMKLYPNPRALSRADVVDLERLLSRIGYHKKRAKNLVEIAAFLMKNYGGEIPKSKPELLEIPFVGDYTANALMSLGYGKPAAMVDSNVERIVERLFLNDLQKTSVRVVQKVADLLSPIENSPDYNYALLDLGALVCRYGIPRCKVCPINNCCDYYRSGKPHTPNH